MGFGSSFKKAVKKATKQVSKQVSRSASQVSSQAKRSYGQAEKQAKRTEKAGERLGKKAFRYQTGFATGGLLDPGGSGYAGDLAESVSGGMLKSGKTERYEAEVKQEQAKQQAIIDAEKAELDAEEKRRKDRVLRRRQGMRSLLFSGSDELGVKKSTLG